jgi:hypothetical protein
MEAVRTFTYYFWGVALAGSVTTENLYETRYNEMITLLKKLRERQSE